ncbi:ImpA family type VI secretion system protein [Trabulsiella odontotermitis]|uniref:type VI secretion system protein TssA n=1 Tax=Trabulsiella odontotermitis TaxID=379893 RepID=UPI000675F823|nr:type VI secretion system ImpA family N-terminal domain-containing protein [Trabulsiella odontotermitis]KNC90620.1 membrane protein [Trabulsiella odontotermitis]
MTIDTFSQEFYGVEFDPMYGEIESMLAQLDESSDPLAEAGAAPQVNWSLVAEHAKKMLEQCYDLRVALWLIRANMYLDCISAVYHGITELGQVLMSENNIAYPKSETDNSNEGHAAALGWLSAPQFIAELKSIKLTREHNYQLHDLINVDANSSAEYSFSSSSSILLAINTYYQQNSLPDFNEQLTAISQTLENVEAYANQYSEGYLLDCHALRSFLTKALSQLKQQSAPVNLNEDDINAERSNIAGIAGSLLLDGGDANIRSRQEIILMLDRILDYFQRYEPSHPAPIFIRRSKQMIGMDFISIVEELLPESMNTLQQFTGNNNITAE